MTNLLLIIIIPPWSQTPTAALALASQPTQGWVFLCLAEVEIQRMNNLLPRDNLL